MSDARGGKIIIVAQMQAPRQQAMARRIQSCVAGYEYDDPELQRQALAVIPVTVLHERARKQREEATDEARLPYRDALLVTLLIWYTISIMSTRIWISIVVCCLPGVNKKKS